MEELANHGTIYLGHKPCHILGQAGILVEDQPKQDRHHHTGGQSTYSSPQYAHTWTTPTTIDKEVV